MRFRYYAWAGLVFVAVLTTGVLQTLWVGDASRETRARDVNPRIGAFDSGSDEISIDGRSAALVEAPIELIDSTASDLQSDGSIEYASVPRGAAGVLPATESVATDRSVVEPLLEALEHPDPLVFEHAVEAVSQVDPEWLESVLEDQLKEGPVREGDDVDESKRRTRAAWGLGIVGGGSGVDSLISAFYGSDPDVREAAANSLAKIGDEGGAREFLFDAAEGSDPESKGIAISALAFEGDEDAKNDLADAFDDGSIALEDVPDDVLEELSIPSEGPGCLGTNWVYPGCSRVKTSKADEVSDGSGGSPDEGSEVSEGGCLGAGWRYPDCSRE